MKKYVSMFGAVLVTVLAILACALPSTSTNTNPTSPGTDLVGTQVALALTQTAISNLSQPPDNTGGQQQPTATETQAPPPKPTDTEAPPPPTELDIAALIDDSNILIYEDIIGDPSLIPYVRRALQSVGGHHEYVGDAMGTFMDKLDSGTHWDLIIMASEIHSKISGDYWTAIKDQVDDGAALVSETWYLDKISDGKIAPFLNECGVKVEANWARKARYDRLDYAMYWIVPDSPVFNTPNTVDRFGASLSTPAFMAAGTDIGDLMEVTNHSKAQILASLTRGDDTHHGVITTCMNGRVIMQTFDSHDYPTNEMVALWENYINYTLTNHFTEMYK